MVEGVRGEARARAPRRSADASAEELSEQRDQYPRLRLRVLAEQADRLQQARTTGTYSSAALNHAQSVLDADTARVQQLADRTGDR